jgi:ubiquinone/menaquinone biosynthesis C-methylase UbiE
MFYTLRPIRRLLRRRRHGLITAWARGRDRTLHVGCGSGIVTQSLNNGIGMDLNLGKLRFLSRYGVAAVSASADAMPFCDGTFDCLIGSPDIEAAPSNELREMHRVLRADGTFIFATPRTAARNHQRIVQKLAQSGFAVEEGPIATFDELLARCRRIQQ